MKAFAQAIGTVLIFLTITISYVVTFAAFLLCVAILIKNLIETLL